MAKNLVTDTYMTDIADTIRARTGGTETYKPADMATALSNQFTKGDALLFRYGSDTYDATPPNTATSIPDYSFYHNLILKSLTSNYITSLGASVFQYCSQLATVDLPNCISISVNAFNPCIKLATVNLPNLTTAGNYVFAGCVLIAKLDFNILTTITIGMFGACAALTTLILRSTTVATLANINAFTGTPIASGTGYIYVPDDLVDTYKTATNWVTYAAQIKALSAYTG